MDSNTANTLRQLLLTVLSEMEAQEHVASSYPPKVMPFPDQMKLDRELIEIGGEYGIAFEDIIASLKALPFVLSGKAAAALVEAARLMKWSTPY